MLTEEKFLELEKKDNFIKKYYYPQENGYYKCRELTQEDKEPLKEYFTKIGFSALNFTDSRGIYQFYNLGYLTKHISVALKNNLKTLNLAVEPVTISELYKYIYEKNFKNELIGNIPEYNFKTKYDYLFGGKNGYIFDKEFILKDIKKFVQKMQ